MKQYSIRFIGRNAYISDAEGHSTPILSIDFKSVQDAKPNGTTLDIDQTQPIVVNTQTQNIKIFKEDILFIGLDDELKQKAQ